MTKFVGLRTKTYLKNYSIEDEKETLEILLQLKKQEKAKDKNVHHKKKT